MNDRARVLIAENDEANIQLLVDICSAEDLDVEIAHDGEETLAQIRARQPDLVLLDVMMPQKDGFEVLQELRANPATRMLPVILVTAVSDDDSIRQGYGLGANDYITKPFKVAELVARMKSLIKASAYQRISRDVQRWQVGDRAAMMNVLEDQLSSGDPCSLVLYLIQDLKAICEAHSSIVGDQVLDEVSRRLRTHVRGVDSAFILDVDKVAVILVDTDEVGAASVAQRLLKQLKSSLTLGDESIDITTCCAITTSEKPMEVEAFIEGGLNKLP